MIQNIGDLLRRRARTTPEVDAYVQAETGARISFAELNARANQVANAFKGAGVKPGDRVAFLLMNGVEFVESYLGLAKLGAVVVPLNWRLTPPELEFIISDSGATWLIFDDPFAEAIEILQSQGKTGVKEWLHVLPSTGVPFARTYEDFVADASRLEPEIAVGGDEMLYIMYTSGTTGLPKGVVHSHRTSMWAVLTMSPVLDMRLRDRFISLLPMFHVGALAPIMMNVYNCVTSVVLRSFDPKLTWELIERESINSGLAVPAMLNFMLQVPNIESYDCSSLRWILSGAAPVPVALIKAYAERGIEIHQVYGLTESCGPSCVIDAENAMKRAGSTGRAFFHTDVRILDADGDECPANTPGEVVVRGAHNMHGYWNQPEATAQTLRDGWLHTGDIATMDEDGFVTIQDRKKDMIISGGENVYPAEIENLLMEHAGVREAAVIGQPSERWGESPFAILVSSKAEDPPSEGDIMEFLAPRLARFKMPKAIAFIDEIPRNPSGKILKRVLREQFPGPAPE